MKTLKILLVDDSQIMRESLKQFIEGIENVKVVGECSDGNQVLEKLKQIEVDLVFSDVTMKDVGGFDTTKIIKKYNKEIRVVLFSLLTFDVVEKRMKECGADGFISKVGITMELVMNEFEKIPGFKAE